MNHKVTRRFLGKTEDFKDKAEQRFEQAHLKAYKKGHERFKHGHREVMNGSGLLERVPAWHDVKQSLK